MEALNGKKYHILVLSMSLLHNPLTVNGKTDKNAFDNLYAFREYKDDELIIPEEDRGAEYYKGIGQLEPIPQYIIDISGSITHYVILQTAETQRALDLPWNTINKEIENRGDGAKIAYDGSEKISSVEFFKKRIEAIHLKKHIALPEFIDVDINEHNLETGIQKLLKDVNDLYKEGYLKNNPNDNTNENWKLWVDIHGGFRDTSLAMLSFMQILSAPDEQELKSNMANKNREEKRFDEMIARHTDGKSTIPVSNVYTIYFNNDTTDKNYIHPIVSKKEFFNVFTKPAFDAYMNYGQYAQLALRSTIELKRNPLPPFAFISYRRIDAPKERISFIGILKKLNYRYWYDDQIELQAKWQDTLKEAVSKSSVFFALITKTYFESYQCIKEFKQALDENKTIILVSLDQTPLYISEEIKKTDEEGKNEIKITMDEMRELQKRQHLNIEKLVKDGVFQTPALIDELNNLCEREPERFGIINKTLNPRKDYTNLTKMQKISFLMSYSPSSGTDA